MNHNRTNRPHVERFEGRALLSMGSPAVSFIYGDSFVSRMPDTDVYRAVLDSRFGTYPCGTEFLGKIDLQIIGTMGHSRGGEGVVEQYLYNQELGSPYGIEAVFAIAPVDFSREVINGVPLRVMLPYNDGDVLDLQGVHFFDDARYNVPGDQAPKHTFYVLG